MITGGRTYTSPTAGKATTRCGCRASWWVPCFVITHDAPDGPMRFTYVTDGNDSPVRQAKAVAGEKDVSIMGGASIAQAGA